MSRPLRKRLLRGLTGALVPAIGPTLLRLLAKSWRVRRIGEATEQAYDPPPVFALWHEHIPAGAALHTRRGYTVLISSHHDGELITRIIEALGFHTARGSSTRGGSRAMRQMLSMARDCGPLVITPDGPRGPAYEPAPGVFFLAAATGRVLIPVGFAASRAWRAGSWDRMVFAKPFSRVAVVYARPMTVPRDVLRDEARMAEVRSEFIERFRDAYMRAEQELSAWQRGRSA